MGIVESKTVKEDKQLKAIEQGIELLRETKACSEDDKNYSSYLKLVARLIVYGHRNLLTHFRQQPSNKQQAFLRHWLTLNLQTVDLVPSVLHSQFFQNHTQAPTPQFQFHSLPVPPLGPTAEYVDFGHKLLSNKKVAIILFVGSSGYRWEAVSEREFYKNEAEEMCALEIQLQQLKKVGERHGLPPTYLFYNAKHYTKVTQCLSKYGLKDHVVLCLQSTQPLVTLSGQVCLKEWDLPDIVELPTGSGDFYNATIRGVSILEHLKAQRIEYIHCLDCENLLSLLADPYLLGLLYKHQTHCDVFYKCTYSKTQKETHSKRILCEEYDPKVDYFESFEIKLGRCVRDKGEGKEVLEKSLVWMNNLVFSVQSFEQKLRNLSNVGDFYAMFSPRMRKYTYWSPLDKRLHESEPCYVFERELSDLLINTLFKSTAVMVDRAQEYLPLPHPLTEASWNQTYRSFLQAKPHHEHNVPTFDANHSASIPRQTRKIQLYSTANSPIPSLNRPEQLSQTQNYPITFKHSLQPSNQLASSSSLQPNQDPSPHQNNLSNALLSAKQDHQEASAHFTEKDNFHFSLQKDKEQVQVYQQQNSVSKELNDLHIQN